MSEHPERPERPERLERPGRPESPEGPERPKRLDRPERPERPERLDGPDRPEGPEWTERPEWSGRPERLERPERPVQPEPEAPEAPDRPERTRRSDWSEWSEQSAQSDRSEWSAWSQPPERPERGPAWLRPLVEAVRTTTAADFLRIGAPLPPPDGGRRSAVLILFGPGPDLLLIERSDRLRKHAGQPAFPGGAVDPTDDGPVSTALRESAEEVGLDPAGVEVVALLPELFLPPTGFLVTPVLAWWHTPSPVGVVDPVEVARVERVPLAELVDPANRCRVRGPSGYAGPAFAVRGMMVWGFTAAVLDRILEFGGWARPWNADDVRDLPQRKLDLAVRGVPPGYATAPRGGPELPEFREPSDGQPPEGDDGPAAEEVLPADEHGAPG